MLTKLKVTESHDDAVEPKISEELNVLLGWSSDGRKLLNQLEL